VNTIPNLNKWDQLKDSLERRKKSAPNVIKIGRAIAPPSAVCPLAPAFLSAPEPLAEVASTGAAPPPLPSIGFRLFRDFDSAPLKVSKTVEQLAGRLLGVAAGKVEVALLWPGTLRSLASAHAVATVSRWHVGDKMGLRTLVYPAKANIYQDLNHALVDRLALAKLSADLYEPPQGAGNPKVITSFPAKDAFFTSLRSVRSSDGTELQPTLGEVLPHFFSDLDFAGWKPCDNELLKNLKSRLGDVNHTKALNSSSIPRLGAPSTAPDAIFALGWRTPADDIEAALKSLKALGSPNAVLVDVTRAARRKNPKWLRTTARFIEQVGEVWPVGGPGICVVVDEPHVRNQLSQEFARRAAKGSASAERLNRAGLPLKGVPSSTTRSGFLPEASIEPLAPAARSIAVGFTDSEASELIAQVDRLKNSTTDSSFQAILGEVAYYLGNLAALPSSTRVLVDWLNRADMPIAVREAYTWPSYRSKLQRLITDPAFKEKTRLERVISKCDALWTAYENGTPFARQLADLIEEHTRGSEKCCVVFTKPTSRLLAERYFETFDGYPEGAGFEVLRDSVRMVVSGSLESELGGRKETLIFAGLDEDSIRTLILDDRVSPKAFLLLTRRNASYLKSTLRAVDGLPEFEELSPRVKPLLKQLPDFAGADARLRFTREDFVLPSFSFEQALSGSMSDEEASDPDAWEIILEGGRSLRRSPGAKVYVYDPLFGYTATRGFRPAHVSELQEGQRLFVMSSELRELTEASLKEAGVHISQDKQFETSLREYHTRVVGAATDAFGAISLTDQARQLRQRILDEPEAPKNLPSEGALKSWLNVSYLKTENFDDMTSQAPRHAEHFRAFAKAIGLSELEAVYFWKAVIQPLRGVRRADGRRISDAYADMLLEPESAVVHRKMKPEVVSHLFARAEENVYTIEAIKRPTKEPGD
jgi:hypothetical protein